MAGRSRDRVLETAQRLFRERGFASVTLQDIARELNIRKPSLYYHFPEGKEEIYLSVHRRMFEEHARGLNEAVAARADLEARLLAVADWLLSHPPMFLMGMYHADLDRLSPDGRASMFEWSYRSIIQPVVEIFRTEPSGDYDPHVAAGILLSAIESNVRGEQFGFAAISAREMTAQTIRIIVDGWRSARSSRPQPAVVADSPTRRG